MALDILSLDQQHFWRQLVEGNPDFVVCLDREGKILYINRTPAGISRETAIGSSAYEFVPPQSIEVMRSAAARVFATGLPETYEIAGAGPNGTLAWYFCRVGPVLHEGQVAAVTVSAADISERRRMETALQKSSEEQEHRVTLRTAELAAANDGMAAEIARHRGAAAALEESERKYRMMFEANPVPMWVYDIETLRFLAVNRAAVDSYGWSEAKFLSMTLKDIRPLKEIPKLIKSVTTELPGPDYSENWRHLKADGSVIWANVASHPVVWEGRQARLVMAHDVTKQRLAEEELIGSRRQYAEAQQLAHLGSWDWDLPAQRFTWSDELYRIHGYAPGEFSVTLDSCLDRIHPDDRDRVRKTLEQAINDRQPFSLQHRIIRPDGGRRTLQCHGQAVLDSSGMVVRLNGTGHDITERKQVEQALDASERKYRLLFEDNPEAMWVYDRETLKFLAVNARAVESYGWSREEFLGMKIESVRPPEELDRLRRSLAEQPDLGHSTGWIHWRKDGSRMWVNATSRSITFAGRPARLVLLHDVTVHKAAEEALRESHLLHQAIFDSAADAFVILNDRGEVLSQNDTFTRLFGYAPEELKGTGLHPAIVPVEELEQAQRTRLAASRGEIVKVTGRRRRRDGANLEVEIVCSPVSLQGSPCVLVRYTDITERRINEEHIERLAFSDSLTGLPNRAQLANLLQQSLHLAERQKHPLAVLFIDLDRFKTINDSLGHDAGDALLREAALRLAGLMRKSDVLARLGGDEFIIVLNSGAGAAGAAQAAQKIIERFQAPFNVAGAEIRVTPSIGISLYPEDGAEADQLIKNADAAMYRAKENGRNNFQLFAAAPAGDPGTA